jgi:predicted lipoprotein with Yx(FWY)xxD motif
MEESNRTAKPAVGTKGNGALGQILDAGNRRLTVYLFAGDHGKKSYCAGACAKAWPPVTTAANPKVAGGARRGDLGSIRRSGSVKQVTYKGHPLYFFVGDRDATEAAGQAVTAFGAKWYVLSPTGRAITKQPSTSTSSTQGGGQSTTPATSTNSTSTPPSTTTSPTQTTTTSTTPTTTTETTTSPAGSWS